MQCAARLTYTAPRPGFAHRPRRARASGRRPGPALGCSLSAL